MGTKTVPHSPYSPDLAPCDFWLFSKLIGCRYETIEEMKEAVTKVIDTLTQEDFDRAFQKLLERYNKWIAAGGDYFEEDESFMRVLSIKVPIRKKSGNLFNDPRICINIWHWITYNGWYSIKSNLTNRINYYFFYKLTLLLVSSNFFFSQIKYKSVDKIQNTLTLFSVEYREYDLTPTPEKSGGSLVWQ